MVKGGPLSVVSRITDTLPLEVNLTSRLRMKSLEFPSGRDTPSEESVALGVRKMGATDE